jgi:hypothetical protein
MIAGRLNCRASSINTLRAAYSTAAATSRPLASSFLRSSRPSIQRFTPTLLQKNSFAHRNFFATMAVNTPYVTLNDGNKMPQVGFGLWKVDNATCADTVYNAIKAGYRLFDGACGTYILILYSQGRCGRFVWGFGLCYHETLHRPVNRTKEESVGNRRRGCQSDLPVASPSLPLSRNVSVIFRNIYAHDHS